MNSNPPPAEDKGTTRAVMLTAAFIGLLMLAAVIVGVAFKWNYHNPEPAAISTDKPLPGQPAPVATK
jgi:hypothetical protein